MTNKKNHFLSTSYVHFYRIHQIKLYRGISNSNYTSIAGQSKNMIKNIYASLSYLLI